MDRLADRRLSTTLAPADPGALAAARALFDPNPGWVYLDTATVGLPPRPALDRLREAEGEWQRGDADWEAWDALASSARQDFATLIGASAGEVALHPSISIATGLVAASLPAGAVVVTAADEYSSVILPMLAAVNRGTTVREVAFDGLVEAVDAGTTLVAVSAIQMHTGRAADLAALAERCRDVGARLLVDGTQGIPFLDVCPVIDGVDYLVCAAYKHLLTPHGCAFFHVRRDRWEELAPFNANLQAAGHGAPELGGPLRLQPAAARFDTSLASLPWVAATESLRLMREWDGAGLLDEVRRLAHRLADGLRLPPPASSLVCLPVRDPTAAAAALRDARIRGAIRVGHVRLAPHLWTTDADVDQAVDALRSFR